jgi:hypothetical protein
LQRLTEDRIVNAHRRRLGGDRALMGFSIDS